MAPAVTCFIAKRVSKDLPWAEPPAQELRRFCLLRPIRATSPRVFLQARGSLIFSQGVALARCFLASVFRHWLLCPGGVRLMWGFVVQKEGRLLAEKAI